LTDRHLLTIKLTSSRHLSDHAGHHGNTHERGQHDAVAAEGGRTDGIVRTAVGNQLNKQHAQTDASAQQLHSAACFERLVVLGHGTFAPGGTLQGRHFGLLVA